MFTGTSVVNFYQYNGRMLFYSMIIVILQFIGSDAAAKYPEKHMKTMTKAKGLFREWAAAHGIDGDTPALLAVYAKDWPADSAWKCTLAFFIQAEIDRIDARFQCDGFTLDAAQRLVRLLEAKEELERTPPRGRGPTVDVRAALH